MGFAYVAGTGTLPSWQFFDDLTDTDQFLDDVGTLPEISSTYGYYSFTQGDLDENWVEGFHAAGKSVPGTSTWDAVVWVTQINSLVDYAGMSLASLNTFFRGEDPDYPFMAICVRYLSDTQTTVVLKGFGSTNSALVSSVPSREGPVCLWLHHDVDDTDHNFTAYYRVGTSGAWTHFATHSGARDTHSAWEGYLRAELVVKGTVFAGTVYAEFDRWTLSR